MRTLDAIQRERGANAFHYRYSGAEREEGCFLACTFWLIEARALLGQRERARAVFDAIIEALSHGAGVSPEMVDPQSGEYLGNLPQGLTHLTIIQTLATLASPDGKDPFSH